MSDSRLRSHNAARFKFSTGGVMNLLVVADNPDICRLIRSLFAGVHITECHSASRAPSVCAAIKAERVLFDLDLSGGDALEALRHICQSSPQADVVAMSADDNERLREAARLAGASHYQPKDELIELRERFRPTNFSVRDNRPGAGDGEP